METVPVVDKIFRVLVVPDYDLHSNVSGVPLAEVIEAPPSPVHDLRLIYSTWLFLHGMGSRCRSRK